MTDEQFDAILAVHVVAPFRILRAASEPIRRFAKQETAEGREVFRKVVNISSVSGLGGNAGQVNYSAAKAAVVGMTKTLCKEWGRYRVNVNCVAFGPSMWRGEPSLSACNRQCSSRSRRK
jgi:3-oxoacyl-[acyl-carrier protein] reductase